jgi:hypothetical protein
MAFNNELLPTPILINETTNTFQFPIKFLSYKGTKGEVMTS